MTASLETLVVTAYLFADELAIPRPGPRGEITDAELIALAVAQASMGVPSDRQFLGLIAKVLPGWFPHLPCQSQYNRRLRRLAPAIAGVQLRIAELIATHELVIADGTLVGVANYAGCASRSEFAGTAAYGYCAAKSQYVWGVRLVLMTDPAGVPVGYTLVAANEKEYEPVRELATAHSGCTLIADKGLWGREYRETLALQGIAWPACASSSSRRSPISNARCDSSNTSRRHPRGSCSGSLSDCSHSPSACSSTP